MILKFVTQIGTKESQIMPRVKRIVHTFEESSHLDGMIAIVITEMEIEHCAKSSNDFLSMYSIKILIR